MRLALAMAKVRDVVSDRKAVQVVVLTAVKVGVVKVVADQAAKVGVVLAGPAAKVVVVSARRRIRSWWRSTRTAITCCRPKRSKVPLLPSKRSTRTKTAS